MNEPVGAGSHAGVLPSVVATRSRGPVRPTWEGPVRPLSMKDSVRAGAFLIFCLALYWAAGYAGITLIEWAWMKAFG